MKLEITQKGVFAPNPDKAAKDEMEVPVGETITIKGNKIPNNLKNKCRVVGQAAENAVPVVNEAGEAEKADIRAQLNALGMNPHPQTGLSNLRAALEQAKAGK